MVTIGLSTMSVITSIFVVRINDSSTPMPQSVRSVVFRYAAPVLRVSVSRASSMTSTSVGPDDASCGRTPTSDRLAGLTDPASGSQQAAQDSRQSAIRPDCCVQLKTQVDSLLCELKKVNNYSVTFTNASDYRTEN